MKNKNIYNGLDELEKIANPVSEDPRKFSVAIIFKNIGKRNWIFRDLIDLKSLIV